MLYILLNFGVSWVFAFIAQTHGTYRRHVGAKNSYMGWAYQCKHHSYIFIWNRWQKRSNVPCQDGFSVHFIVYFRNSPLHRCWRTFESVHVSNIFELTISLLNTKSHINNNGSTVEWFINSVGFVSGDAKMNM